MSDNALFDVPPAFDRDAFHRRVAKANADRDRVMARINASTSKLWQSEVLMIVKDLAETGRHFTSDDVMDRVEELEIVVDARALGPVMKHALNNGWMVKTGYAPSRRRHSTPINQYVGLI
jgi:hypothetical protein